MIIEALTTFVVMAASLNYKYQLSTTIVTYYFKLTVTGQINFLVNLLFLL